MKSCEVAVELKSVSQKREVEVEEINFRPIEKQNKQVSSLE